MYQLYQLLEHSARPIPQAPTHCVLVDVLNKDMTIKRITIYFNPADTWGDETPTLPEPERNIGLLIGQNLRFVGMDSKALAYRFWVTEINTQKIVLKPQTMLMQDAKY